MIDWGIPVVGLNAVTLTGTVQYGPTIDLEQVANDHAAQSTITYTAGDLWLVGLQGSLDGTAWYDIGALAVNGGPPASGSGSVTALVVLSDKPARFLRIYGQNFATGSAVATVWLVTNE